MANTAVKSKLTYHVGEFMGTVLLLQPVLDVLSYFMGVSGHTVITTALRMALLTAVSLYGFFLSDHKQLYAAGYAVIGGFWLLHMLNCVRVGYAHPVGDAAEYLKLVQLPLWTISFLSFFRKREELDLQVQGALTVNFGVILLVIALSYLTGMTVFTYEFPERQVYLGVMGWFGVPNAQSVILCLLVPSVLLWGLRSERLWLFCACVAAGFALLYFTGTRLTFFAAVLLSVAFVVLIFAERRPLALCIPLLAALVLLLAFRWASPMERRQEITAQSFAAYQEKIDAVMGEDKDFTYEEGKEISPAVLEKIERVYTGIYGKKGIYGEVLWADLFEEFGVERVMKELDYTISPKVLNNSRARKLAAMRMIWEDQDFLTHLLGVEYSSATLGSKDGGHNYDPENDFPALLYFNGYLGTALYAVFLISIFLYAVMIFFRRFPALVTAEFGTQIVICALALGAALYSGWVLRRPNVTVYFSLALAQLFFRAQETPPVARLRPGHRRNPAVYLKKIK